MIFENWLQQLSQYNILSLTVFFFIENTVLFCLSIIIGRIIEPENTLLKKTDVKWLASTVICNTFITLFGYELYHFRIMKIDFSHSILHIFLDLFLLILLMDFFMFCFHYLVHRLKWFHSIHKLHHTHIKTSVYSLYVLHPVETLGFGFIWLFLITLIKFNYISIIIYLILNLLYGIFGHINKDFFPLNWDKNYIFKWISNTKFHHNHHQNESKNYGFYFTFWDKIFRTKI